MEITVFMVLTCIHFVSKFVSILQMPNIVCSSVRVYPSHKFNKQSITPTAKVVQEFMDNSILE